MNKFILIIALFSFTLSSFGQTKKKIKHKKSKQIETINEKKVTIEDDVYVSPEPYFDAVAVPDYDKIDTKIYETNQVEVYPEFPGGTSVFYKYVAKNFNMPEEKINGKIFTSFIIEADGNITDIKIIRGFTPKTDRETLRVLKNMPKWMPAELNGRKVRCRYQIPIIIHAE